MTEEVGDFEYNPNDLIGHGAFAVVFKGRKRKVRQKHDALTKCFAPACYDDDISMSAHGVRQIVNCVCLYF
jgi:hypothetical protein